VGTEPAGVSFGTREEVIGRVLADRYRHWKRWGREARTYITTNLALPALQERYGRRVTDRLAEMCAMVRFEADSVRQG